MNRYAVWLARGKPDGVFSVWHRGVRQRFALAVRGHTSFLSELDAWSFFSTHNDQFNKWLVTRMALDVRIEKCKNPDELVEKTGSYEGLAAVPACLSIYLGSIGMPAITEENADQVFLRLCMWQQVQGGGPFVKEGKNYRLTHEHVVRCIGMETNHAALTMDQFKDRCCGELLERGEKECTRQRLRARLLARGCLFGEYLAAALRAFLQDDRYTLGEQDPTLADFSGFVKGLGPKEWQNLVGAAVIARVSEANVDLARLADAYALDTSMFYLQKVDAGLPQHRGEKRKAKK